MLQTGVITHQCEIASFYLILPSFGDILFTILLCSNLAKYIKGISRKKRNSHANPSIMGAAASSTISATAAASRDVARLMGRLSVPLCVRTNHASEHLGSCSILCEEDRQLILFAQGFAGLLLLDFSCASFSPPCRLPPSAHPHQEVVPALIQGPWPEDRWTRAHLLPHPLSTYDLCHG